MQFIIPGCEIKSGHVRPGFEARSTVLHCSGHINQFIIPGCEIKSGHVRPGFEARSTVPHCSGHINSIFMLHAWASRVGK